MFIKEQPHRHQVHQNFVARKCRGGGVCTPPHHVWTGQSFERTVLHDAARTAKRRLLRAVPCTLNTLAPVPAPSALLMYISSTMPDDTCTNIDVCVYIKLYDDAELYALY